MTEQKTLLTSKTLWALTAALISEASATGWFAHAEPGDWVTVVLLLAAAVGRYLSTHALSVAGKATLK